MTKADAMKIVLVLAVTPIALSLAACSQPYTPQRTPSMLMATPPIQHGRMVVPGEADDYQEWLAGEPNLANDLPWRDSRLSAPQVTSSTSPTPNRTLAMMPSSVPPTTTTQMVYGERITVEETFPPYSRR